ncbi:hypothetical protein [Sphingobacterium lumbrici]|uniref:hypothetical protein n=1 Tax=Sphingobacterium lumbrici TaxID=2559600 RepID=UPI0011290C8F|nr:hypothetical protein [Sphingobacterium lumbrici]
MKKLFILFTFLNVTLSIFAQSSSDIGKIALSVIMPENVDGLDVSQLSKLETKITEIVSSSGLAASGYNNNFVIYPKFAVYETNVVEGGMQNITVTTCEISLFIKQVDNNILFSSISKQVKGSGNNKQTSLTNAISKIPTKDTQFQSFIETGKNKIVQYYESKCEDIISKSESLVKMQNYEEALGLLQTVPEKVSCYSKIQEKSIEAYKAYQNQKCSTQIQEAKSAFAANDYNLTLELLSQIDPSAICFKESQQLMKTVENKIDTEEKKQWDLQMKIYNDAVSLEKQRINAIKEIAVAYYKSKPSSVNYSYIIK